MSTMPFTSTASVDGIDLLDSLQQSLLNLRECWPAQWPGLALVFDRCLQRLGWSTAQASPRLQTLVNCAHEIAANIEGAARALHAAEPAYHNRLHMADTMVCMTHLLLSQRRTQTTRQADACLECIALVVMLGHDYLHNGKVNRFPAELETIAVEQLTPIMAKHQVAQADQEMIAFCILKTDPSGVKQSHGLVAEREFVLEDRDCLAVLVQDDKFGNPLFTFIDKALRERYRNTRLVSTVRFPRTQKELKAEASKVLENEPNAVIALCNPTSCESFVRSISEQAVAQSRPRPTIYQTSISDMYAQFKKLGHAKRRQGVPQDVVNRVFEQSLSPMAAWREHLSLTQAAVAADMGITQAAYAQMERSKRPRRVTLERVAQAMGLQVEQLNW